MKLFIVFVLIIASAMADELHTYHKKTVEDFRKVRADCFEKFHVSNEIKEQLKKFEYKDDETVHNYLHCASSTLGVWCDKEGYHKESLMTQFGEDKGAIVDKCITKKDDNWSTAKWAWSNWKCMVDGGLIKQEIKDVQPN